MRSGLLIDESGEPWPVSSPHLARHLGYDDPRLDLSRFAVARRGCVHLRPIEDGVRVALCPSAFSRVTLAGTLQALNQLAPRRILLITDNGAELFASIFAFIEHAEYLASDPPLAIKVPWYSVTRSLRNLSTLSFSFVWPLMKLWRNSRGEYDGDVYGALISSGIHSRTVVARRLPRSSRLICEHFGGGLRIRQPCESLLAVGRGLEELYDRKYGDWSAEGYGTALAGERPRLESIRARVQVSETLAVNGRYDRVLLPWRRAGGDALVMGISIRRELSTVS
jgi:hypothetical protein